MHQEVHICELQNLEERARKQAFKFCFVCGVNKIKGAVAGFTLNPIAMP
jgi:hypothetical protein